MKSKAVNRIFAFIMAFVMVISLAPSVPAGVSYAAASDLAQGIYEALTAEGSYFYAEKENVKDFLIYDASIEDDRITISVKPTEAYAEDVDERSCFYDVDAQSGYVSCSSAEGDYYTEAFLITYMADAIARYKKIDYNLLINYINAVSVEAQNNAADEENVIIDTKYYKRSKPDEHGICDIKLYAGEYQAGEINEVLDRVYFDEKTIQSQYVEALEADSQNGSASAGKYRAVFDGNNYSLKMYFSEYGSAIDEKGFESIKNLIAALKPVGYENFIAKYDSTASFKGSVEQTRTQYSVYEPTTEDKQERFGGDPSIDLSKIAFLVVEFESPYIYTGMTSSMPAGDFTFYSIFNSDEAVKWTSSDKKVATIGKDGMVVSLKKGTTTITATLESGFKLTTSLAVTSSPSIKVGGKKYSKSKTYTVKKGKTLSVKLSNKSSFVDNKYSSTKKKIAKVTSKKTAETVKIKSLKKGTSTITITVNGVAFKIKVKVK